MPPVPLILAARLPWRMKRALPPMNVSSSSTSPASLLNVPVRIANRIRWNIGDVSFRDRGRFREHLGEREVEVRVGVAELRRDGVRA